MKQNSLKIAYLISRYPAYSHTFILREIRELRNWDIDLNIASINAPEPIFEKQTAQEKEETLKTFYVKQQGALKAVAAFVKVFFTRPLSLFRGIGFALYLASTDLRKVLYHMFYLVEAIIVGLWMEELQVTHLHVHFATPASTVALILTKIFPYTFSMTVHGPDEFYDVSRYNLKEKIQGARFICCIAYYTQSQLMKIAPLQDWTKFEITPLGINCSHYFPSKTKKQESAPVQITCVGRLVPTKGQHILIAALSIIIKQGLKVSLRLVGDGPDRLELESAALKRGLKNDIEFTGALNQQQILELYHDTDIFVLASFAEGVPVSLMEAMSMEIPCIATNINGIPELIRHQIDGLLVTPSDVEELANTIAHLVKYPKIRNQLGKAGRQRILEKYQLEPNVAYLAKVFHKQLYRHPTQVLI